jgi:hypothetical protein
MTLTCFVSRLDNRSIHTVSTMSITLHTLFRLFFRKILRTVCGRPNTQCFLLFLRQCGFADFSDPFAEREVFGGCCGAECVNPVLGLRDVNALVGHVRSFLSCNDTHTID